MQIHKKLVVDEQGRPREVIIPWKEFQEIVDMLGLDLDQAAMDDLRQARRDRETTGSDEYVDLDSL